MTKNSKLSLIAAIPAFILLFVIRLMLITGGTDWDSGAHLDDIGFLADISYYALLVITLAALTTLGILERKKKNLYHTNEVTYITDMHAVMLGFPLLIAGALMMYEGYMQTQSITPSAFLIFVGFLCGMATIIVSFIILYKKVVTPTLGFCLVIPAAYYTLRGIGVFLDRMVVAAIPEYLIECLSYIGAAVFFMQPAKLLTGNESKTTRVIVSVVGLTTALMILSSAFAVIAADLFFPDAASHIQPNAAMAELCRENDLSTAVAFIGAVGKVADIDNAYALHSYHMAYTSWVDVCIALCMVLTVVSLHFKTTPAAPETKQPKSIDDKYW